MSLADSSSMMPIYMEGCHLPLAGREDDAWGWGSVLNEKADNDDLAYVS